MFVPALFGLLAGCAVVDGRPAKSWARQLGSDTEATAALTALSGRPEAAKLAIRLLRSEDEQVVAHAQSILRSLGADAPVDRLYRLARYTGPEPAPKRAREAACGVLPEVTRDPEVLVAGLVAASATTRARIADALTEVGEPAVVPLVAALSDPTRASAAGRTLARLGPTAVGVSLAIAARPPLPASTIGAALSVNGLLARSRSGEVAPGELGVDRQGHTYIAVDPRDTALRALEVYCPMVRVPAGSLNFDPKVHAAAESALQPLATPSDLCAAWANGAAEARVDEVLRVARGINEPDDVPFFAAIAVVDPDVNLAAEAAAALALVADEDQLAKDALQAALSRPEGKIVAAALAAFSAADGDRETLAGLVAALGSPSQAARMRAQKALPSWGMRGYAAVEAAMARPATRPGAVGALGGFGTLGVDRLVEALNDPDPRVRVAATNTLRRVPTMVKVPADLPPEVSWKSSAAAFKEQIRAPLLARAADPDAGVRLEATATIPLYFPAKIRRTPATHPPAALTPAAPACAPTVWPEPVFEALWTLAADPIENIARRASAVLASAGYRRGSCG